MAEQQTVTVMATELPRVVEVLPSYYFAPLADVSVLACGHRHLRPRGTAAVGDFMHCVYCDPTSVRP